MAQEMPKFEEYPFHMAPIPPDDGGGYLITFPDLPGCNSDGETPEEAIEMGRDAFKCWMSVHLEEGREIPAPGSNGPASGRFNLRAPKSLHAKLARQAEIEGVSMNTLAVTFLAECLGKNEAR